MDSDNRSYRCRRAGPEIKIPVNWAMRQTSILLFLLLPLLGLSQQPLIEGEAKTWHAISLTFDGPYHDEQDSINPFTDYQFEVSFQHSGSGAQYQVTGHFAADGAAAETGATAGDKWRAYFMPPEPGLWTYAAEFRTGPAAGILLGTGTPAAFHGSSGSIAIAPTDKAAPDHRAQGLLAYDGGRYLRFQGDGSRYLKGGAAGPETFLACTDIDGTYLQSGGAPLKDWAEHLQDDNGGGQAWRDSLGRGMFGAIDYLASQGANALSLVLMNASGNGRNVWPWTSDDAPLRYDVSKLDQWERVFAHADTMGIVLHIVLQEDASQYLLDSTYFKTHRYTYFRQMASRFAHHPAILWGLAEHSTETAARQSEDIEMLAEADPYRHPIFLQNPENGAAATFGALIGNDPFLAGPSLNVPAADVHSSTLYWQGQSAALGQNWIVHCDEQNPSSIGVTPTAGYPGMVGPDNHDAIRKQVLYGNLMAGGAGVEYYFGANLPQNDLDCEDYRSRDSVWKYNRIALSAFREHVPYWQMQPRADLLSGGNAWCLAQTGQTYAIYAPEGNLPLLDLDSSTATFDIFWMDPRRGGPLLSGSLPSVTGPGLQGIGIPPYETDQDWLAIVREESLVSAGPATAAEWTFELFPNPAREQITTRWEAPRSIAGTLTISDSKGKIMGTWNGTAKRSLRIDTSEWPAGIYAATLRSKAGQRSLKFILY